MQIKYILIELFLLYFSISLGGMNVYFIFKYVSFNVLHQIANAYWSSLERLGRVRVGRCMVFIL